jgi:hypothetical protein
MALAVVDDDMIIPGGPYVTPRYARADSFDAGFKVAISHTRDLLARTWRVITPSTYPALDSRT